MALSRRYVYRVEVGIRHVLENGSDGEYCAGLPYDSACPRQVADRGDPDVGWLKSLNYRLRPCSRKADFDFFCHDSLHELLCFVFLTI